MSVKNLLATLLLMLISSVSWALETTPFGKITSFETRSWGMHINVDFAVGEKSGCKVEPGATYMLDLNRNNASQTTNGNNFDMLQSVVLAAFIAQREISFHIYECGGSRPRIGHVRVRN